MKSWALTSSRPRSSSSLSFDRNRIQTDVSTGTLMLQNAWPRKTARAVGGCREHVAPTPRRARTRS